MLDRCLRSLSANENPRVQHLWWGGQKRMKKTSAVACAFGHFILYSTLSVRPVLLQPPVPLLSMSVVGGGWGGSERAAKYRVIASDLSQMAPRLFLANTSCSHSTKHKLSVTCGSVSQIAASRKHAISSRAPSAHIGVARPMEPSPAAGDGRRLSALERPPD